ncbi:hypothetical protein MPLA_30105 [Mesorhizobium sp. ORS 3359]|nr:hypothetical protein MPLA_30105 [Mesorhizobium sp. ORS 3359]
MLMGLLNTDLTAVKLVAGDADGNSISSLRCMRRWLWRKVARRRHRAASSDPDAQQMMKGLEQRSANSHEEILPYPDRSRRPGRVDGGHDA